MLPLSTPLLNKLFPYSILQTITSPKPSPPPTLKSWWLYRWNRFRQRTDKWELLQWYLVILAIIACIFFSSLYQGWVMDLDRTNRIFYKKVIMDEHRVVSAGCISSALSASANAPGLSPPALSSATRSSMA